MKQQWQGNEEEEEVENDGDDDKKNNKNNNNNRHHNPITTSTTITMAKIAIVIIVKQIKKKGFLCTACNTCLDSFIHSLTNSTQWKTFTLYEKCWSCSCRCKFEGSYATILIKT